MFFPGGHVLLQIVPAHGRDLPAGADRRPCKRQARSGADDPLRPDDAAPALSLLQNAMTGPDTSLLGGAVAAGTLLILNYLVADVAGLSRRSRKVVEGEPSLLIHDRKIIESHMAKEHVSLDELHRSLREHGINAMRPGRAVRARSGWIDLMSEI
jgi:hypothetical protein